MQSEYRALLAKGYLIGDIYSIDIVNAKNSTDVNI